MRFAPEIGAEVSGLVGGARPRWRPPGGDEIMELASLCDELANLGNVRGAVASYRPHVACTIVTSSEINQLLAQSQSLKLCLGASHIARVDENPLIVIDQYRDRIGYLHLEDWGHGKFRELGRGDLGIDFKGIVTMLQQRDFDGWVVLEQNQSGQSPLERARINAAFLHGRGYDVG